ncbi:hypothetical protein V6N12_012833 [Hibiscus sabdariffa]|uniref:Uncharacterized protein n=1 Tax=Hibiscus sabdariffa TaxID=183260 RepID=A0ABR2EG00_9ROSI
MWNEEVFIASQHFISHRFIAIVGLLKKQNIECGLLNVYGPSVDANKSSFFSEVSEFLEQFRLPWCICGNFNVYLQVEDKLGGPPNFSSMEKTIIGSKKVGALQLLKGAKIAIKDWAYNTNNTNPRKVIKDLEAEISMLELNQEAGRWDSLSTKRIAALREQELIANKYSYELDRLLPSPNHRDRCSWIWMNILKSYEKEDHFGVCLKSNLRIQVGDGKPVQFWLDIWICNEPLSTKFLLGHHT